jgi:hypothetical protein
VRSYRTLSPLPPAYPGAVYSLRHFPSRCHGRELPGMPSVMESGPSSETEVSADARLLQPRQAYQLFVLMRGRKVSGSADASDGIA